MIITKHSPWIECEVNGQPAWCLAWYDYDQYSTTEWKCVIKATGILVSVYEEEIRLDNNWTMWIGDKGPPGFESRTRKSVPSSSRLDAKPAEILQGDLPGKQ